jgi:hypothetical protein
LIVLRDILSANRLYKKGQYTLTGKPITKLGETEPTKITLPEAYAKALGFQPLSQDKGFRLSESLRKMTQFRTNAQSQLASRYANAFANGDDEEMIRVVDEAIAWNTLWGAKGKPEYMIDPRKAIESRMKPSLGDKRMRGRALELQDVYGE